MTTATRRERAYADGDDLKREVVGALLLDPSCAAEFDAIALELQMERSGDES